MELTKDKLNVSLKTRANIFNWRGQFTPQFVEYIIDQSNLGANSTIADPFVGSGTVLIEAAKKGHNSIGFEINPAAYQMAKFYEYAKLDLEDRNRIINGVQSKLSIITSELNGQLVFTDNKKYRESYFELIRIAKSINEVAEQEDQSFLINILIKSEKDKKLKLIDSLRKSFIYFRDIMLALPVTSNQIEVHNLDAKLIGQYHSNSVDLILSSPPYINVFNYHQNYRAVTESFNYNILSVAHSEFGSNRKNRGNRVLTVIQYCVDMELALKSFWESLKPNGKLILVVGRESNVRKTAFYNSQIVSEIISAMGGFIESEQSERSFTNKFGQKIYEDILIYKAEKNTEPSIGSSYQIAKNHIKQGQKRAPEDVLIDFENALKKYDTVKPSPIYKV